MRRAALVRAAVLLALTATLAGCFGGASTERESESFWDETVAESAPAPAVPEYTVARGDTLYMIAFRRGLDWRELAAWNHIPAPYRIYPEQRLKLGPEQPAAPPSTPAASVAAAPERVERDAPAAEATPGEAGDVETYAVRDSGPAQAAPAPPAASVSKTEAPPPKPAGREPPAETEGSLTRAIRGPASTTSAPAAKTEPAPPKPEPAAVAPKPDAAPAKPTQVASATPSASAAAPIPAAPSRSAAGTSWRWPAQGALVGRFLPGDPARQGINVQGKPGGTVSAAADGEVVYSGNGLVGYGELIIVKHNGELLSAYGGSGKRLVAEGTKVRSGQPLAELAGNGIVHFEIRRSGKPVDPLEYLPGR